MKTRDYFEVRELSNTRDYGQLPETGGFIVPGDEFLTSINFDEPIRYVALLRLVKDDRRGNHYHREKIEHLAVLEGTIKIELRRLDSLDDYEEVELQAGSVITIQPLCHHVVTAQTNTAVVLETATTQYVASDVLYLDS